MGVLGVALATVLLPPGERSSAVFVLLLIWSVGLVAGLVALVADVSPGTGAAGGLVARAVGRRGPCADQSLRRRWRPGATRPGLAICFDSAARAGAVLALCALSGWSGARAGPVPRSPAQGVSGPLRMPAAPAPAAVLADAEAALAQLQAGNPARLAQVDR